MTKQETITKLVGAAKSLGHYATLRETTDDTLEYWEEQVAVLSFNLQAGLVVTDEMARRAWCAGQAEYARRLSIPPLAEEPDANEIASMKAALNAALKEDT